MLFHLGLPVLAARVIGSQYLVPLSVPYALLIAGLFRGSRGLKWIGAVCFLSLSLGYSLALPLTHIIRGGPVQADPPTAIGWIRAHVGVDEKIVGEPYYFLFLADYRQFIAPDSAEYAHAQYRARFEQAAATTDVSAFIETIEDVPLSLIQYRTATWDAIAPEVVIIDPNLSSCCVMPILNSAYLESRGYQLVATFDGTNQPVLIYRMPVAPATAAQLLRWSDGLVQKEI